MKFYIPITLALLTLGTGLAIYTQTRPDPDLLRFEVSGERAYGYGVTDGRSIADMKRFTRDNPAVKTLVLKSMGGTHDSLANLRIARHFRASGLAMHLEGDSYIASGAVDLFLSGTRRTMECGARIGVHSWGNAYYESGQDDMRNGRRDEFEGLHKRFLKDMGITPGFYIFTRAAAPPSGIYWLTMEDLRRFDLLSEYPDCES
ncbi:MAG: hypothetical protein V3U82_05545 [Robiginitomaculum sp.]